MHESSHLSTTTGAMPAPPEPEIRPACGPVSAGAAGSPEMMLLLIQDPDRIAAGLNDIVLRRLFSAGLALEAALGLMGEHRAAGRIQHAISELDRQSLTSGTRCLITAGLISGARGTRTGRFGCRQAPGGLRRPGVSPPPAGPSGWARPSATRLSRDRIVAVVTRCKVAWPGPALRPVAGISCQRKPGGRGLPRGPA